MSLLSRLFLLVAVSLLPAVAIQAYNEFDLRRSRQIEVQDQALRLAILGAAEQQQIVQGVRQVLIALSELPAVKAKDVSACNAYLSRIKRRYPEFLTFAAADMSGLFFCDTSSYRRAVNAGRRRYFHDAVESGGFTVGTFLIGQASGRKIIPFALPFYGDDGRMAGVVIASLSLSWLADYLARKGVPAGGAITITDRDGTVLARYPQNDRFVGWRIAAARERSLGPPGTADMPGLDGIERLIGYAALRADSGALLVSVGLDKRQAFAGIERRTRQDVLLIALGTALVLCLTWLGARRFIHRPLGELGEAANHWRRGDYSRRVKIPGVHSEIARVGAAFNGMAEALEDRERELFAAKEKAEEAASRIMTIFESTTDSIIILDQDWRFTYLNERAKAQIGPPVASAPDLIGVTLGTAFPDAAGTELDAQFRAAMAERRPAAFEAFCPRVNRWFAFNAFTSSQGLIIQFRDITEHKRAVEARRAIEEQLHQSQKMEAIGQLTGGVAHDFNNLLGVVSGNLGFIVERAADEAVRQFAAAAALAADRGAKLTSQLLAFSRRQTLNPIAIYADRLIREFEELIRRAIGQGYELKLISHEELWPCRVDPTQLETALLNLTLNGRDAMPEGGMLRIEARNVVVGEEAVAGLAPGAYVCVSVADSGRGISPENLDRVFEPFFTTKDVGKGTGLGLSMVYGFVRQSGGHVAIESALGAGTTVTLYLPKAAPPPDIELDTEPKVLPPGRGRILLVEDDEQMLDVTAAMLDQLGYHVAATRDGTAALAALARDDGFDLLVSDIGLPHGMSGIDLAREAKQRRAGIKVLLTSGYADGAPARQRALDEFPVISKPFRKATLAEAVSAALEAEGV